jgi:hypothetical protein
MKQKQQIRTIAVENFLMTLDMNMDMQGHYINALRDAYLYKWNEPTLDAIFKGIQEAYAAKEKK